jgi:hypothetical protein
MLRKKGVRRIVGRMAVNNGNKKVMCVSANTDS